MKHFKTIILTFIMTFSLLSCKNNTEKRKEIVIKKITQFSDKQAEWNNLTNRILENQFVKSNLGKGIYPTDFEKYLSTELIKNGVKRITVHKSSECKEVEYEFDYEYPIGTLHLTWTTCAPKQTEKGYYQSDSNYIEIYGIGNNWLIWTDGDPI
ncbi:hypothetical protein [Saccharicrinis sp. FJH54]|uniref:hypothetical protein n=1 Tax=Saccharicrinis sp. FJH54 TaxID=3344665 RepID=UPI0035D4A6A6